METKDVPGYLWSVLKFKHRLCSTGTFFQSALLEAHAVLQFFSSSLRKVIKWCHCLGCGTQEKYSLYSEVVL